MYTQNYKSQDSVYFVTRQTRTLPAQACGIVGYIHAVCKKRIKNNLDSYT